MTQKWLIFPLDVTAAVVAEYLAANPDVVGYYTGVPPFLQGQAQAEGWVLPYIWIEQIN